MTVVEHVFMPLQFFFVLLKKVCRQKKKKIHSIVYFSFGKSNGSYDFQPYSGRVFSIVNENNENEVIRDTNSELVAPQTDVKGTHVAGVSKKTITLIYIV